MDASQLGGAYEATTSSDCPKQPRCHRRSTQQHSSTAAAVQHIAAAVQAVAFVADTVFRVCRTHNSQLAGGHPTRILPQQQQQYVATRKTQSEEEREVQFEFFPSVVYAVCCCVLV